MVARLSHKEKATVRFSAGASLGYALRERAPFGRERRRFDSSNPEKFLRDWCNRQHPWPPTRKRRIVSGIPLVAGVAQRQRRRAQNAVSVGSNPTAGTNSGVRFWRTGESHKLRQAGSIPAPATNLDPVRLNAGRPVFGGKMRWRDPHGVRRPLRLTAGHPSLDRETADRHR